MNATVTFAPRARAVRGEADLERLEQAALAVSPCGIGEERLVEELAVRRAVHLEGGSVQRFESLRDFDRARQRDGRVERRAHEQVAAGRGVSLERAEDIAGVVGRDGRGARLHARRAVP